MGSEMCIRDRGSNIYAIWSEYNGSKQQIRVKKFNGNNSWSVDKASLNDSQSQDALNPTMEEFSNRLYAVWQESNGTVDQIRVASTDGTNWGSSTGINLSDAEFIQYLFPVGFGPSLNRCPR